MIEVEFKSMKRKFRISLLIHCLFVPWEFHRNKNKQCAEIQNGKCLSFLHLEVLGTPRTIFQHYHPQYFHVFYNAKPPLTFYFWLCIKPEAAEDAFLAQRYLWLLKYYAKSGGSRNVGQSIINFKLHSTHNKHNKVP